MDLNDDSMRIESSSNQIIIDGLPIVMSIIRDCHMNILMSFLERPTLIIFNKIFFLKTLELNLQLESKS